MRMAKSQLQQIIKEEMTDVFSEAEIFGADHPLVKQANQDSTGTKNKSELMKSIKRLQIQLSDPQSAFALKGKDPTDEKVLAAILEKDLEELSKMTNQPKPELANAIGALSIEDIEGMKEGKMKFTKTQLQEIIKEEIKNVLFEIKCSKDGQSCSMEEEKDSDKDPNAKVRNRGNVVFPAESSKVKDDKDHFPINSKSQARNALSRASQYSSVPPWYAGSLSGLVGAVQRKVKAKYPGIETTKASKKPGKG